MSTPVITAFELGSYLSNSFVVTTPGSHDCWIIDCGENPEPMLDHVEAEGLKPAAILLTHCHLDHIAGIDVALSRLGSLPIYAHAVEAEWNMDPLLNLSAMAARPVTVSAPDHLLNGGEVLELNGTAWRVVHGPGHSPGSILFVHDESDQAIVGDTLFAGSIGRMDFPTSDPAAFRVTIGDVVMGLPDSMRVYPGHGPPTTIGHERTTNPFVVHGF